MKICVLGLGYVGAVSAACLARDGHEVIGVDPERAKVDLINAGRSPIIEKDLGEIIAAQVRAGRLHATTAVEDAGGKTGRAMEQGAKTAEAGAELLKTIAWLALLLSLAALVSILIYVVVHKLTEKRRHATHSRGGPTGGTAAGP